MIGECVYHISRGGSHMLSDLSERWCNATYYSYYSRERDFFHIFGYSHKKGNQSLPSQTRDSLFQKGDGPEGNPSPSFADSLGYSLCKREMVRIPPPFAKGDWGEHSSPFRKGGLRGIFRSLILTPELSYAIQKCRSKTVESARSVRLAASLSGGLRWRWVHFLCLRDYFLFSSITHGKLL